MASNLVRVRKFEFLLGLERVRTRTRRLEDSEQILETRLGWDSKAKTRQTRESSPYMAVGLRAWGGGGTQ